MAYRLIDGGSFLVLNDIYICVKMSSYHPTVPLGNGSVAAWQGFWLSTCIGHLDSEVVISKKLC